MASSSSGFPVLYKPAGSPNSGNPGRITVATAGGYDGTVQLVGPDGTVIGTAKKDTVKHVPEPGETAGPFGQNWWFPVSSAQVPAGSTLKFTDGDTSRHVALKDPTDEIRGSIDTGEGTADSPAILPVTSQGEGSGIAPGFAPGSIGYGSTPAFLGNQFPNAAQASYTPIQAAAYKATDPLAYAKKADAFNRDEISANFDQAQGMALKEINTESQALQEFVPAAAALKRSQTSIDNQFNQQQRTDQVNSVLPHANTDLEAQRVRANTYASGTLPNSVDNAGLLIATASAAADRAAGGGFGGSSQAARTNAQQLTADQDFKIAQYGESLLGRNLNESAALNLASPEYSNAGTQINVNPTVGTSQLTSNNLNTIDAAALLPTTAALQSTTSQNQYATNLQQSTNTFNASNELQNSQFNTGQTNSFALDKFGYEANYAGVVAGAAQTNTNTQLALQQQQQEHEIMQEYAQNAQLMNGITSGFKGLGSASAKLTSGKKGGGGGGGGLPFGSSPGDSIPGIPNLSVPDFSIPGL